MSTRAEPQAGRLLPSVGGRVAAHDDPGHRTQGYQENAVPILPDSLPFARLLQDAGDPATGGEKGWS